MLTRRAEFWAGVRATIPLVVGAIPFGIIFGAVAVTSGLSPAGAGAMSALVYAGSAQFIAVGLIANGTGPLVISLTTLIVNLRHALYGVSLAPHMQGLPQRWLALLGFWLVDESYVLVIDRYNQPDRSPYKHWFFVGSAVFMYTNWQLCTYIGIQAGQWIADPRQWGLDFAFAATFIGILVPTLRTQPMIACALVAGVSAVIFHGLPHQLGLLVAALLGVATGMLVRAWRGEPAKAPLQSERTA
jgi:4-azaleucine resistance transporter AzlC